MKITKSQLKQIIKEELNELDLGTAESMPAPAGTDQGTDQGINVVRRHLGEMVAELSEGGLGPDLSQTMGRTGHTGSAMMEKLAVEMYHMIMRELGG